MVAVVLSLREDWLEHDLQQIQELDEESFRRLEYLVNLHKVNSCKCLQTMLDYYSEFDTLYEFTEAEDVIREVFLLKKKVDIGSIERVKYLSMWFKKHYKYLDLNI